MPPDNPRSSLDRPARAGRLALSLMWLVSAAVQAAPDTPPVPGAISLRDAAALALRQNPELSARAHAHEAAQHGTQAARTVWWPRVGLAASTGVNQADSRGSGTQRVTHGGAGLTVTQRLWDEAGTRLEIERAGHEQAARWHEWNEVRQRTLLEVTEAYAELARASRFETLAQIQRDEHRRALAKLEARLAAGAGRGVDVEQARSRLLAAESEWAQQSAARRQAQLRYQRTVGAWPGDGPWELPPLDGGLSPQASTTRDLALRTHPAIAAQAESVRGLRVGLSQRRADRLPRVEARLRAGGGHHYGGVDGRQADVAAEVTLSWTLFDGGERSSRESQQAQLLAQAQNQRDATCGQVHQAVAQAYLEWRTLDQVIERQHSQVTAIEGVRATYHAQFDVGQRSVLDMLNVELEVHGARRALASSQIDRLLAQARAQAAASQLGVVLGLDTAPQTGPAPGVGSGDAGFDGCPSHYFASPMPGDSGEATASWAPLAAVPTRARASAEQPAAPAPASAESAEPSSVKALPEPAPLAPVAPVADRQADREPAAPADASTDSGHGPWQGRIAAWAASWSSRDFDRYRAHYAPDFGGSGHTRWAATRRAALQRHAQVELTLGPATVQTLADGRVRTRFTLAFRSPSLSDQGVKTLVWAPTPTGWHIIEESGR